MDTEMPEIGEPNAVPNENDGRVETVYAENVYDVTQDTVCVEVRTEEEIVNDAPSIEESLIADARPDIVSEQPCDGFSTSTAEEKPTPINEQPVDAMCTKENLVSIEDMNIVILNDTLTSSSDIKAEPKLSGGLDVPTSASDMGEAMRQDDGVTGKEEKVDYVRISDEDRYEVVQMDENCTDVSNQRAPELYTIVEHHDNVGGEEIIELSVEQHPQTDTDTDKAVIEAVESSIPLEEIEENVVQNDESATPQKIILVEDFATEYMQENSDNSNVTEVLIVGNEDEYIYEHVFLEGNENGIVLNDGGEIRSAEEVVCGDEQKFEEVLIIENAEPVLSNEEVIEISIEQAKEQPQVFVEPTPPEEVVVAKPVKALKKNSIVPSPDVKIPCHMLGRTVDNPTEDVLYNGRTPPKPRLGVKVPYRNLTSQIVTKQELANEILERSKNRNPLPDPPEGGDIFFAKKLTQRLANKLAPLKKLSLLDKNSGGNGMQKQNDEELISETKDDDKSTSASSTGVPKTTNDNADLIALLEGDGDVEWNEPEKQPDAPLSPTLAPNLVAIKAVTMSTVTTTTTPSGTVAKKPANKVVALDVEAKNQRDLERIIALKQLRELPILPKVRKGTGLARRKKLAEEKARKEMAEIVPEPTLVVANITKTYSRKRKDEEEMPIALMTDISVEEISPKVLKVKRKVSVTETVVPLVSKRSRIIKKKVIWDPDAPKTEMKRPKTEMSKPPTSTTVMKTKRAIIQKPSTSNVPVDVNKKTVVKVISKKYLQTKRQLRMKRKLSGIKPGAVNKPTLFRKGKQHKRLTEIDKLLMDEGAVNMLYAVKQTEADSPVQKHRLKRKLISHSDLVTKTKEIKNDLTSAKTSPSSTKTLRKKEAGGTSALKTPATIRKKSQDSNRSSMHSPPPSPGYSFRQTAECSRIIRRHSSTSSYSSDNEESGKSVSHASKENAAAAAVALPPQESASNVGETVENGNTRPVRKKGVPIYVSHGNRKTYKGKRQKVDNAVVEVMTPGIIESANRTDKPKEKLLTSADKAKLNTEMAKNFKRCSSRLKQNNVEKSVEPPITDNGLSATEELPNSLQNTNYKEISLRKLELLVQIVITPPSSSVKNTFSVQMFREICEVLNKLKTDTSCRAVLLTSAGSTFCHGVDWLSLVHTNKEKRKEIANSTAKSMKEFLLALSKFPKPLIAGIQGTAENLAVTMLPLFDMVLASDKATFRTPYAKVGSVPEGGTLLTLGHLQQSTLVSELLLTCKKLTASEALRSGLVTRVLWPDKFHEELIPIAKGIASQSAQSMQATKMLLRLPMWNNLDDALTAEQEILINHWMSEEFQKNVQLTEENDD